MTEMDADAVLLAAFGSGSLPLTVPVLVMVPPFAGAVALIVNVMLAPEASVLLNDAAATEIFALSLLAAPPMSPAGRVSVTTTPVAALGPLFLAVTV